MPIKLILSLFFFSTSVYAQSRYQMGLSTRSRAMGGTSIALARGVEALYHNPAALTLVEGYAFTLANLNVGASTNSQRLFDQLQNSGSAVTAEQINSLYGENYFTEASVYSGMVMPNFGIGGFSQNYATEIFNNPVYPTFNVDFKSDYGYTAAFAIPLNSTTSLGIAGRHVVRWGGNKDILVSDLIGKTDRQVIEENFNDKGQGNALDISFLALVPSLNLSLAAVWKDVGSTAFTPTSGVGPERQEDNLSLGAAMTSESTLLNLNYAIEYNFIKQSDEFAKKIHAGVEVSAGLLDIRAGLSQGYLTYGVGLDFSILKFDASAYTEELGANIGDNRNDRYQASVTLQLDFDQTFKLKNSEGKKRRLMKRR